MPTTGTSLQSGDGLPCHTAPGLLVMTLLDVGTGALHELAEDADSYELRHDDHWRAIDDNFEAVQQSTLVAVPLSHIIV
ncbi:hypothetical protein DJ69_12810 [Halorubrum persicum]|uniref:Uncharacterized protein n=1 Tax=Halorubrum persicum TaxID=1383844 RepID=A0A2G1WHA6_9EURY|nr:hypothetical protein [Halorubrum persicum]PHQ38229.1 hypothetical protein DJ69_12810 [Halorubrum persicum]